MIVRGRMTPASPVRGESQVCGRDEEVQAELADAHLGTVPECGAVDPLAVYVRAVERTLIDELFSHGLVDVGRHVDPDNDRLFTWWAPWRNMKQRNIGWRLDYVLASESLAARATSCVVQREFGTSDHGPVLATFAV